jgi:hypothetical protein
MSDIAALRLRAFSAKLALKRLGALYRQLRAAKLLEALPEAHEIAAAPGLKHALSEFGEVSNRLETQLFEEVTRLAVEAEEAANTYARARYGFGPGEVIKVEQMAGGPARLRVAKVYLQSGTETDIRVEASALRPDGTPVSTWDLYYNAPGQLQSAKGRRPAPAAH